MICNFFYINDIYVFSENFHEIIALLSNDGNASKYPITWYFTPLVIIIAGYANHIKSLGLTKLANPTLSLILGIWFAKDIGLVSRTLHGLPFIRETLCK